MPDTYTWKVVGEQSYLLHTIEPQDVSVCLFIQSPRMREMCCEATWKPGKVLGLGVLKMPVGESHTVINRIPLVDVYTANPGTNTPVDRLIQSTLNALCNSVLERYSQLCSSTSLPPPVS